MSHISLTILFPGFQSETFPLSPKLCHVGQVTLLQGQNPQPWTSRVRWWGAWSGGWAHSSRTSPAPLPGISLCLAFHEPHLHKGELNTRFSPDQSLKKQIFLSGIIAFFLCLPWNKGGGKRRKKKAAELNRAALRETGFDIPGMTSPYLLILVFWSKGDILLLLGIGVKECGSVPLEEHFRSSKKHFDLGIRAVPIVLVFKEKKNCKQTSLTCLAAEKNTHKGDF